MFNFLRKRKNIEEKVEEDDFLEQKEIVEEKVEEKIEVEDPMIACRKLMCELTENALKEFPIWMRLNYLVRYIIDYEDEDINWTKINELLKSEDIYDFNDFDYISSKEQFESVRFNACSAGLINGVFRKCHCVDCNEDFYLTYGETSFYQKKKWPLPKHCPSCKDIKNGVTPKIKPVMKKTVVEEIPMGPINGFADAFKKVGIEYSEN